MNYMLTGGIGIGEEILFKPLSGITLRPSPPSLPVGKQTIIDAAF